MCDPAGQGPREISRGQPLDEMVGVSSGGRTVYRHNGENMSEKSTTEQMPDGRWANFPTIHGGVKYEPDDARKIMSRYGMVDPETGRPANKFGTAADAVNAAIARSGNMGITYFDDDIE